MKKFLYTLMAFLTLGCAPAIAQTTVDSTVCTACVAVITPRVDTTITPKVDTLVKPRTDTTIVSKTDTVITVHFDTSYVQRADTSYRQYADTIFTTRADTTYRDSTIKVVVTPPPPPIVGACSNDPGNLTLISSRSFTAPDPKWIDVSRMSFVADPTAPDGDGMAGQETYGTNNRVGNATMASYMNPNWQGAKKTYAYTCFYTKLDPTFTFTYQGGFFGTKQFWFMVGPNSGENKIFTNFYSPNPGNGNGLTSPVCLGLVFQGVPSEVSHGTWCNSNGQVQRGVWYRVELYCKMNSVPSASDGFCTMWVNGAVVADRRNVRFTQVNGMQDLSHGTPYTWTKGTDAAEWYGVKWNNTLGGGSAYCTQKDPATQLYVHSDAYCFAPKTQWIRMDKQIVKTK